MLSHALTPPTVSGMPTALTVLGAVILTILANSDEIEVSLGRIKLVLRLRRKPRSRGRS